MNSYDVIKAILDSDVDAAIGRTAMQKLAYLAMEKISGLDIPDYRPHYYGPYSAELRRALERMVRYSFVNERKIPGLTYEGYRYEPY